MFDEILGNTLRIFGAEVSGIEVVDATGKSIFEGDIALLLFLRFKIFPDFFVGEKLYEDFIPSENSFLTFCARTKFAAISLAF